MKNSKLQFSIFSLVFLLLFSSNDLKAGGPWLLNKNAGYFQLQTTFTAYRYNKVLTGLGIRDSRGINREIFHADYGIYAEYGLTKKLDVLASIPFKYADAGDRTDELYNPTLLERGSINGLSNMRFGLKYGILDKDLKIAISAQTSLNTASADLDKGLATGFLGNSFGLFAHVGGSFGGKWYAFAEMGFMKYTNDFSDVIEGRIEVGRNFSKSFTMMLTTEIRQSLENGSFYSENLTQTGLYPNDQEWIASTLKANYELPQMYGINLGLSMIPFQFDNVGFAGAISVGIYKKW